MHHSCTIYDASCFIYGTTWFHLWYICVGVDGKSNLTGEDIERFDEEAARDVVTTAAAASSVVTTAAAASSVVTTAITAQNTTKTPAAQVVEDEGPVTPDMITAKMVVNNPEVHLEPFQTYWGHRDRLPDMTLKTNVRHDEMGIYLKHKYKGRTERRKPHSKLKGLCGTWANRGLDWCIMLNLWAIRFVEVDGEVVDILRSFIVSFWGFYVACMHTRPGMCNTFVAYVKPLMLHMCVFGCL